MAKELTPPPPPRPALWSVSVTQYDTDDRPMIMRVVATTIPEAVQKVAARLKEVNKTYNEEGIIKVELLGRET